ncbi:hypothetical protein NLX67_08090 [Domibacillus sp. A3M-37]|uniref:hypothetical protein n=1 Tax=Domibacillus sp. A3M-37 TaxID=2962037 RepID=UPI0020B64012|nr:hypothetical protein [Domibacillus sp. A3M-37]MCP3762349.1 hypothetical protein [Domibacillus sp. A3M-37]
MSTQHCRCGEYKKHYSHHSHCDECKKNHPYHSPYGCKSSFKADDFRTRDQRFFSFQHDHHMDFHSGCQSCFKGRFEDHFENRSLCDDRFSVRLGGLKSSMAFRMRQLMDSNVKITLEEGGDFQGEITFVGTDFVEIACLDKKSKNKSDWKKKYFLIQFDKIKWVEMIGIH